MNVFDLELDNVTGALVFLKYVYCLTNIMAQNNFTVHYEGKPAQEVNAGTQKQELRQ